MVRAQGVGHGRFADLLWLSMLPRFLHLLRDSVLSIAQAAGDERNRNHSGAPYWFEELAQVKGLLATQPDWSRWRVSVELAWMWNGRTPTGQLKDMAARTLLLKLEQRRW